MKKLFALIIVLVMLFSLTACGKDEPNVIGKITDDSTTESVTEATFADVNTDATTLETEALTEPVYTSATKETEKVSNTETTEPVDTETDNDENKDELTPLDVITTIWDNLPEDSLVEKYASPLVGNIISDDPNVPSLGDYIELAAEHPENDNTAEFFENELFISQDYYDNVSDLIYIMNETDSSTFICTAFVINDVNEYDIGRNIEKNIYNHDWDNYPNSMHIYCIDNICVSLVGHNSPLNEIVRIISNHFPNGKYMYGTSRISW